jgi:hypothetical protein
MSDRASDSNRDPQPSARLPPGLIINPRTGVLSGVVYLWESGQDPVHPDALISAGVPVELPDAGDPAETPAGPVGWPSDSVTFAAILPPGLSFDPGTDVARSPAIPGHHPRLCPQRRGRNAHPDHRPRPAGARPG